MEKEEIFKIIENAIKTTTINGFNIYDKCSNLEKLTYIENKNNSISYKILKNYIILKYYPMKKINDIIEIRNFDDILPALNSKFTNIRYTTDNNYFRMNINNIEDIKNISEIISIIFSKLFLQYINSEESFGCCSKYLDCSNALHCTNNNIRLRLACLYKHNLDENKIFYGKNKNI